MQLKKTKEVDVSNWKAGKGDVTADQLVAIAQQSGHKLSAKRAAEVAPHLNRELVKEAFSRKTRAELEDLFSDI